MGQQQEQLPSFRRDLKIYSGPEAYDGSPTYTIFDPVCEEYFKASWLLVTIIKTAREGMTPKQLVAVLSAKTTVKITEEEILRLYQQAKDQNLLAMPRASEEIASQADKEKVGWFRQLIFNYLFFRIPLFNPDPFLSRTYPRLESLFSSKAMGIYSLIILWGLSVLAVHGEQFISTFTYFFNLQGFISYVAAISCMKIIHEFSHAYTAKKYGLRVPSMGVAFLVLLPVLYTDVTDAWRLSDRKKRLAITGAGVMAEMVVAGAALILWGFLSPGILQSVCFIIASTNLIHTLAINLNPAMRFDGYYMLSDLMGVENLQTRSFTFLRRAFYRLLFNIRLPWPDNAVRPQLGAMMTLYALFTSIYRVFLYTVIALFVYHQFTKVLGLILFILEIAIFFVWPVVYETSLLLKLKHLFTWNIRTKITTGLISIVFLWFFVPLPHQQNFSAVTVPVEDEEIYAPHAGRLTELYGKRDLKVKKEEILAVIQSPPLSTKLEALEQDKKILEKKLSIINLQEEYQPFYLEKQAELASLIAEIEGAKELLKQNTIKSLEGGILYAWDPDLYVGEWVAENQVLGHLAAADKIDVIVYIPESHIETMALGKKVFFRQRSSGKVFSGIVKELAPIRSLNLIQPQLASVYGGDLPTREVDKKLLFLESYFSARVQLNEKDSLRYGEVGAVLVRGGWTTEFGNFVRWFAALLQEEAKP